MKHGDFTELAKNYIHRPAYSQIILGMLLDYVGYAQKRDNFQVAEVGAGTGKLTKMLLERGIRTIAIEPNDMMRTEGIAYTHEYQVEWKNGSGEFTTLDNESVDWVVMASSFHWTEPNHSLPEFHRILKPGGFFTAIWNPRNIEASPLNSAIEEKIYQLFPTVKRVSSGSKQHTQNWEKVLVSTGHFKDVIFIEGNHVEVMSKERYLGVWNSVNDIRVQVGEEGWKQIITIISSETKDLELIEIPYKNRAWTAQKVD